ncbi:uncharacterized protein EAE97_007186 [Botrytis byssoidea]|uniref:BZIP domain-containing protein n=1 Tax=Botrytis byssoidea TaxID=139641 RepID=A0A9P5IJY8_9HELO|nr:uncharacterized protein EAE97_007186 [Botrytis byssoidea]KAF7939105.1 hypothetical protein EAE97_007186 [Botrytis byssoidea]
MNITQNPSFRVEPMYHLAEAKKDEDDWTGTTDAKERRKRQNRLNIRAFRRRKALEAKSSPKDQFIIWKPQSQPDTSAQNSAFKAKPLEQRLANINQSLEVSGLTFPLPLDHLLTLIQYNVLRACMTNSTILKLPHTTATECRSMLSAPMFPAPSTIPPSLSPTPLQLSTPHPQWIDVLPCPKMRNNAMLTFHEIDEDDLCRDLCGGIFEDCNDLDEKGMLVWNDPWHASGWEITEGFAKKWGFLLKGCHEIVEASNKWRGLRIEDRLIIEV